MRVRAKVKCFVDNSIREEGEAFEYSGPENGCLEPLDPPDPPALKKQIVKKKAEGDLLE